MRWKIHRDRIYAENNPPLPPAGPARLNDSDSHEADSDSHTENCVCPEMQQTDSLWTARTNRKVVLLRHDGGIANPVPIHDKVHPVGQYQGMQSEDR